MAGLVLHLVLAFVAGQDDSWSEPVPGMFLDCDRIAFLAVTAPMYSAPYYKGKYLGEIPEEAQVFRCQRTEDPDDVAWAMVQLEHQSRFRAWVPFSTLVDVEPRRPKVNSELTPLELNLRSAVGKGCHAAVIHRPVSFYERATGLPVRALAAGAHVAVCGSSRVRYLDVVTEEEPTRQGFVEADSVCHHSVTTRDTPLEDPFGDRPLASVAAYTEFSACLVKHRVDGHLVYLARIDGRLGYLEYEAVARPFGAHYYSHQHPFGGYVTCVESSTMKPGAYAWSATALEPVSLQDDAGGSQPRELKMGERVAVTAEREGWLLIDVFGLPFWVPNTSFTTPRHLFGQDEDRPPGVPATVRELLRAYPVSPPPPAEECFGETTFVQVLGRGEFHVGDAGTGSESSAPLPLNAKTTLPVKCLRTESDDTCTLESAERIPAVYLGHLGWIEPARGKLALHAIEDAQLQYWAKIEVAREDFRGIGILSLPRELQPEVVETVELVDVALDASFGGAWRPTQEASGGAGLALDAVLGRQAFFGVAGVELLQARESPEVGLRVGGGWRAHVSPDWSFQLRALALYRTPLDREQEGAGLLLQALPFIHLDRLRMGLALGGGAIYLWNLPSPWQAELNGGLVLEHPLLFGTESRPAPQPLTASDKRVHLGPQVGVHHALGDGPLPDSLAWAMELAWEPTGEWWGLTGALDLARDLDDFGASPRVGGPWLLGVRAGVEALYASGPWRVGGSLQGRAGHWSNLADGDSAGEEVWEAGPVGSLFADVRALPDVRVRAALETAWHFLVQGRGRQDQPTLGGTLGVLFDL
jgi:hypothetical protein